MRLPLIYTAGKYSDKTPEKVWENILVAMECAITLMRMGFGVICPHANTIYDYFYVKDQKKLGITYDHFLEMDLIIVSKCDAVLMLPNWRKSKGAKMEHAFAKTHNIPILYSVEEAGEWLAKWRNDGTT